MWTWEHISNKHTNNKRTEYTQAIVKETDWLELCYRCWNLRESALHIAFYISIAVTTTTTAAAAAATTTTTTTTTVYYYIYVWNLYHRQ